MIYKLMKKHNNPIKSILCILLCLVLAGGMVTSMCVFAEEPESVFSENENENGSETAGETEFPEMENPEIGNSETENSETENSAAELSATGSANPTATYEVTLEEGISVSALAEAGIFPAGTSLCVTLLEEENDETAAMYSEAEAALEENEIAYDGWIALDISFRAPDGTEIEPEQGSVTVKIEVAPALLDEEVDTDSLAVQHLSETEDGLAVELVADAGEETAGTIETDADGGVSTEFSVDSFSYFTLTYSTYMGGGSSTLTVYLVDEDGKDILGSGSLGTVYGNNYTNWTAIETLAADYISQAEDDGYTYEGAYLGSYNSSTSVTYIKYNQGGGQGNQNGWRYSSETSTPDNWNNGTSTNGNAIYLVFKKTDTGGGTASSGNPITFVYTSQSDLDNQTNVDAVKAAKDTVKFTVNLLDENGKLTELEIPSGAVIPDSYTSVSSVVLISELLSQISVPGYTLDDSYAFFFWSGNTAVSKGLDLTNAGAHKVTTFKNFEDVSSWGDGSANLGTTYDYNTYHTIGYTMTELDGTSMTGTDWESSGDTEGYYAYEYGGVLHIVLKPVSSTVAYQTRWVNYAETGDTLVDTTDAHGMTTDSDNTWYGYLTTTTTYWDGTGLTSPGTDYVFAGWYDSCDADGNDTGTKIEGNEVMYSDNTVYARWVLATSTMSVTVVKQVDGNMGDTTKEFSFTVTDSAGAVTSFELADGESEEIDDLTPGTEITISETGNDNYDSITIQYGSYDTNKEFVAYETYKPGVSSSSASITLESGYDVILVTNYKNVDPDTGIHLDSDPYSVMLAGILLLDIVLFGAVFISRRRGRMV